MQLGSNCPGMSGMRIKRALEALAAEPRSPDSRLLDVQGIDVPATIELRRLRLGRWRVIYAVNDDEEWVWVLAIHERPPYAYEDLEELASKLE